VLLGVTGKGKTMNLNQLAVKATVNNLVENIPIEVRMEVCNEIAKELLEESDKLLDECIELLKRLNGE
jgi:predicted NACHT family NTPase